MKTFVNSALTAGLTSLLLAGGALAQDVADDTVIFENSVGDSATADLTAMRQIEETELLFQAWQAAYQVYSEAQERQVADATIAALAAQSDAAAQAYEMALMQRNTMLVAAGPDTLSEELVAELGFVVME